MAPILACSLAAATIIIERLWVLRRARVLPAQLLATLDRLAPTRRGRCAGGEGVAAAFATRPDRRGGAGQSRPRPGDPAGPLEDTGRHVAHELERFLNALGTIAAISPLLGSLWQVAGA